MLQDSFEVPLAAK